MTQKGVSVALACRTFGVSERCYRYVAKLKPENERIADVLTGLTKAHRTWGFRTLLSASEERQRPWLEPQASIPDLPRSGAQLAHQAEEAAEAREAGGTGSSEAAEHHVVNGLHG